MRYVCECRKHKVLGLLWFELVNARGCNGEEDEAGDAKGATAVPHFCSRRPPSPPPPAAEHGFYFVKVDSVFFFVSMQQRRQAAAITFTLQPITWRIGMQPLPDSRHDLLRNAKFFDRAANRERNDGRCWQLELSKVTFSFNNLTD